MLLPWLLSACLVAADPGDPDATLRAIAHDIEALGATYPQLAQFRSQAAFDATGLRIDYSYRTHAAAQGGGWTAGVPNPDDDGVWFHIDVHAADSALQLHTQPVVPQWCLGDRRVSLLILEGEGTRPIGGELQKILEARGAVRCPRS
jgi:hypothetical protein